jgi:GNAT superfamily N-acetyltransferase
MAGYRFCSHGDTKDSGWLRRAIAGLNRLAFAYYDGVVVPRGSFVDWYTARPGMDPRLCQAALAGGELVSSVLVTVASMWLGGRRVQCGIIDEVMTHPDHRRRGLASTLMDRALDAMASAGAAVSLLYTLEANPVSRPQCLYEILGYRLCERVDRFVALPGRPEAGHPARWARSRQVT